MPRFFFDAEQDDARTRLADADLPDREAARQYAIDLAEKTMQALIAKGKDPVSRIVISDANHEELDTVVSQRF